MGKCVIFCAGEFSSLAEPVSAEDYVIAADGGLRHVRALGILPDAILGDFDSLGYVPQDAQVFPVEKDDTDAMLAIRHGLARGFREFWLYGSLDGPRLDHTLANLQALLFLSRQNARGTLLGLTQAATLLTGGTLTFPPSMQGDISIFAFGGDARGVSISGLQYALQDAVLTPGFPLGCSNHFLGREATITVAQGTVLLIYSRC